jgi:hypothetical protein
MSKFVDKLKNVSKSSGIPLGFHPSTSEAKRPTMLVVAGLTGAQVKEAKTLADVRADGGLILSEGTSAKVVKQMVEAAGDVPVGVCVRGISEERINELGGSGCDFMVFDTRISATVLHKEGMGKLLMIEPSLDQGLVKAINSLEVDGVFITSKGGDSFVTLEHLLICRRFVELLEKPVIVAVPSLVSKGELTSLWQAGVDGIVTPSTQSAEGLAQLRKMVDDLPRGVRGHRADVSVRLPHYAGEMAEEEEEQEEEV